MKIMINVELDKSFCGAKVGGPAGLQKGMVVTSGIR